MNPTLLFFAGICMLLAGGAMLTFEHFRNRAGRPLFKSEALAIPYWLAYLALLLIGGTLALRAVIPYE